MKVACVLLSDFEVAVELHRHPELVGRPVVVGGLPHERKVVRSCSPEAAACGIMEGMPLRKAVGLCPEAVFLPVDERLYQTVQAMVLETLDAFSPKVEATGGVGDGESGRRGDTEIPHSSPRTQNSELRTVICLAARRRRAGSCLRPTRETLRLRWRCGSSCRRTPSARPRLPNRRRRPR